VALIEPHSQPTSTTKRIALVSCVAKKLDTPAKARDLYTSPLFAKSLALAERTHDITHILSAHHGLVELDRIIAPYNVTLASFGKRDRLVWGRLIVESLARRYTGETVEFTLFAGAVYVDPIIDVLDERRRRDGKVSRWTIHDPMHGLEIGERLRWLNEQLAS
jgi:hypothetical protein